MKKSEVDKLNIEKTEGIFTPNYSYAECLVIKNEDGEVVDYEYADFILNKTAEEVYQEYLNPIPPLPTVDEKITILEQENLSLMLSSAETYETMYQENVNLMLAVAELYETVMNGGAV